MQRGPVFAVSMTCVSLLLAVAPIEAQAEQRLRSTAPELDGSGASATSPATTSPAAATAAPTVVAASARPAGAPAEPVAQAERYAEEAFRAFGLHEYRQAIALYELAYETAPGADILYNIARVYDVGLGDTPQAIAAYRRYLEQASGKRPRTDFARQRIVELELRSDDVRGTSAPVAASSAVPLGAAVAGAVPLTEQVGGSVTSAEPPPESSALRTESQRESWARQVEPYGLSGKHWTARELSALGLAGAGLVGLGFGVGYGLSAYAERATVRRYCDGAACSSERGVDAVHTATRKANLATVVLVPAVGLLGLGATLWWTRPTHEGGGGMGLALRPEAGLGASGVLRADF